MHGDRKLCFAEHDHVGILPAHGQVDYERPPIDYLEAAVHDPVAQLQERLERGEVQLTFAGTAPATWRVSCRPWTCPFLRRSWCFPRRVFSRRRSRRGVPAHCTSTTTSTWDGCSTATCWRWRPWIRSRARSSTRWSSSQPSIRDSCVRRTIAWSATGRPTRKACPGSFVRSIFPDRLGQPVLSAGTFRTDYTSPLRERWGGWYVTGTHGEQRHMGNVVLEGRQRSRATWTSSRVPTWSTWPTVSTSRPISRPYSDIVALMVLEHQVDRAQPADGGQLTVHGSRRATHRS